MFSFTPLNSKASQFALGLVFIASLAACGGGGGEAPAVSLDIPAVTIGTSPAAVTAAAKSVSLLAGSTITLPALTSKEGVTLTADTKLAFSAIPTGSASGTLAGIKLTSASGKVEEGTLIAGSCIFRITSVNGAPFTPYDITFDPCGIDIQSGGLVSNGTQQNVTVVLSLGGTPVSSTIPVTVTVVNGQAVLTGPNGGTVTVGLSTGTSS